MIRCFCLDIENFNTKLLNTTKTNWLVNVHVVYPVLILLTFWQYESDSIRSLSKPPKAHSPGEGIGQTTWQTLFYDRKEQQMWAKEENHLARKQSTPKFSGVQSFLSPLSFLSRMKEKKTKLAPKFPPPLFSFQQIKIEKRERENPLDGGVLIEERGWPRSTPAIAESSADNVQTTPLISTCMLKQAFLPLFLVARFLHPN